jgi:hypothetical protein
MQQLHSPTLAQGYCAEPHLREKSRMKSGILRSAAVALCSWLVCSGAASAATPFPLGVYVGNPDGTTPAYEALFETNFASFTSAMGATPGLITTYIDYRQQVASWPSNANWQAWSNAKSPVAKQLIPVIGFPMATIASGALTPDQQFQAFAAGQYDSAIQGVVQAWVNNGFKRLVFRLGWEMNITGPTYAGSDAQSQADWVKAFQHISTVVRKTATALGTATWIVWNPNATNYSNANAITSLYPGDSYLDIIGIDMYGGIYPFADSWSPAQYHDWDSGLEDATISQFIADPINRAHYWSYPAATKWANDSSGGHSQSLMQIIQFARSHGKEIAIPETGAGATPTDVADDPAFPQWLAQQLKAAIAQGVNVAFVNIWNSNNGGNYEFSYDWNNKPLERQAWKQYFGQ